MSNEKQSNTLGNRSIDFKLKDDYVSFLVCILEDYIKSCDNYLNMKCFLPDELKCFNAKVRAIELKRIFNKSLESEE